MSKHQDGIVCLLNSPIKPPYSHTLSPQRLLPSQMISSQASPNTAHCPKPTKTTMHTKPSFLSHNTRPLLQSLRHRPHPHTNHHHLPLLITLLFLLSMHPLLHALLHHRVAIPLFLVASYMILPLLLVNLLFPLLLLSPAVSLTILLLLLLHSDLSPDKQQHRGHTTLCPISHRMIPPMQRMSLLPFQQHS